MLKSAVPIFVIQAALTAANKAMGDKNEAEARTHIDLATRFEIPMERSFRYLRGRWPCHWAVSAVYETRGRRQEALAQFERTFRPDGGRSRNHYDTANIEYAKMLQIIGFSRGYGSADFSRRFNSYLQFLRTAGRSGEIPKIEALVKTLRQGGETSPGGQFGLARSAGLPARDVKPLSGGQSVDLCA